MISITTKKGDGGETSLIGSQCFYKDAPVFMVLGDIDELNSWIGVMIALLRKKEKKKNSHQEFFKGQKFTKQLLLIQEDLFTLSAELAGSAKVKLIASDLKKIEKDAQQIQISLVKDWHTKFVYPGGSELAAFTDVARATARRAERSLVTYSRHSSISPKSIPSPLSLKYLNRLSDYLYLLRHKLNELQEIKEIEFQGPTLKQGRTLKP